MYRRLSSTDYMDLDSIRPIVIDMVAGANYGDEGKGLVTDYICRKRVKEGYKCYNMLSNGGPQRSHSVTSFNGTHVFSHFGSGLYAGADLYFAHTFMINPILFVEEYIELERSICSFMNKMDIFVHLDCRMITPFDMILNQTVERNRKNKHSSCGHGIWECELRNNTEYKLSLRDVLDIEEGTFHDHYVLNEEKLRDILLKIYKEYMPSRMENKNILLSDEYKNILDNEQNVNNIIENYISDTSYMLSKCNIEPYYQLLGGYEYISVVIENGQGLRLDGSGLWESQHLCTPTSTGSRAVQKILRVWREEVKGCSERIRDRFDMKEVHLNYVSRTYDTRHGIGPMDNECNPSELGDILYSLEHNVQNEFQGSFRYGRLDYMKLFHRVYEDSIRYVKNNQVNTFFTHCNEVLLELRRKPDFISNIYSSDWLDRGSVKEVQLEEG